MIPKVKTFVVTVKDIGTKIEIDTVTKMLARIIFRQDYMQYWGHDITIGVKRTKKLATWRDVAIARNI